jgi:formamidopyrimidine-DNA glycosylase
VPELPEVETTCRGLAPHLSGRRIQAVRIRDGRLRWPVASQVATQPCGQSILSVTRRAKYLLINLDNGTIIIHLGMSGSLRLISGNEAPRTHDHVEIELDNGLVLRLHDPRRFGSVHFTDADPLRHRLLATLGVEPLSEAFTAKRLKQHATGRRIAVKNFIMDSKIVVGVGNIYASESLFIAGIHPTRPAQRIALQRYEGLVAAIREVLNKAIAQGGTTLRDFVNGAGEPGYFAQSLRVYGRAGLPCMICGHLITSRVVAQRNTFFCAHCQR